MKSTYYVVTPVEVEARDADEALAMLSKNPWRYSASRMTGDFRASMETKPDGTLIACSPPPDAEEMSSILARLYERGRL